MTAAPALPPLQPLTRLQPALFETPAVLKKAVTAGRKLAELKGLAWPYARRGTRSSRVFGTCF
ncbi:hypothetical protein [Ideonella sp. A 288]|uniref:hypothetical protein n=1 Tax=Ideonella sp. A 288 TaxID=1962181 RepID=UPI000B4AE1D2|nr:hypothetical protein [Ideonella sp. A 288]